MDRNANRAWIMALYKTTTRKSMKHMRPIPQKIPIIMTNTNPITTLIASINKIRSMCYRRTPLTPTMMTTMTTLTRMMMMMMMILFFLINTPREDDDDNDTHLAYSDDEYGAYDYNYDDYLDADDDDDDDNDNDDNDDNDSYASYSSSEDEFDFYNTTPNVIIDMEIDLLSTITIKLFPMMISL